MSQLVEVKVPDIGDFKEIPVIEVLVKEGDRVEVDQALLTLESDKATMDVPSSKAGVVKKIHVKLGDKVSEGSLVVSLDESGSEKNAAVEEKVTKGESATAIKPSAQAQVNPIPVSVATPEKKAEPTSNVSTVMTETSGTTHASPSIRVFARELGVDLSKVKASGPKGRILHEDVQAFVKSVMQGGGRSSEPSNQGGGLSLLPWPDIDFAKFGPVETQALSRIKKISGANLHRNWVTIPHVTNHEEADITELEAFRVLMNKEHEKSGVKLTMLAFLIKACVAALKKFPEFNASLQGENIVLKHYYHIGFAADTPNGLVVPVIKNADQKGISAIAQEMAELAKQAREGKLKPTDMQGGTFSISSLGGIGGTYFTPIINAPEVAILGVCKSSYKPVWDGKVFVPRLLLPLSLSWDHRVIDGASAARFNSYLANILADFRRVLL